MAHFLQGMAIQLFLLVIFTEKSDALVFGFLLFMFLAIRWVFATRDLLEVKDKSTPRGAIVPTNYKPPRSANSTPSTPMSLKLGKAEFQMNWD